jgi:hypothetical protein
MSAEPASTINLQRGLFRLWCIASLIFVLSLAVLRGPELLKKYQDLAAVPASERSVSPEAKKLGLVPMPCKEVRGLVILDYLIGNPPGTCWFETAKFAALYPEYTLVDGEPQLASLNSETDMISPEEAAELRAEMDELRQQVLRNARAPLWREL